MARRATQNYRSPFQLMPTSVPIVTLGPSRRRWHIESSPLSSSTQTRSVRSGVLASTCLYSVHGVYTSVLGTTLTLLTNILFFPKICESFPPDVQEPRPLQVPTSSGRPGRSRGTVGSTGEKRLKILSPVSSLALKLWAKLLHRQLQ